MMLGSIGNEAGLPVDQANRARAQFVNPEEKEIALPFEELFDTATALPVTIAHMSEQSSGRGGSGSSEEVVTSTDSARSSDTQAASGGEEAATADQGELVESGGNRGGATEESDSGAGDGSTPDDQTAPHETEEAQGSVTVGEEIEALESELEAAIDDGIEETPSIRKDSPGTAEVNGAASKAGDVLLGGATIDGAASTATVSADQAARKLETLAAKGEVRSRMVSRLADETSAMIRTGRNSAEIRIHPPELGKLRLLLTVTDSVVQARVEVENGAVQQLLQSEFEKLQTALARSGLELSELEVSVKGGRDGNTAESGDGSEFDGGHHGGGNENVPEAGTESDRRATGSMLVNFLA